MEKDCIRTHSSSCGNFSLGPGRRNAASSASISAPCTAILPPSEETSRRSTRKSSMPDPPPRPKHLRASSRDRLTSPSILSFTSDKGDRRQSQIAPSTQQVVRRLVHPAPQYCPPQKRQAGAPPGPKHLRASSRDRLTSPSILSFTSDKGDRRQSIPQLPPRWRWW
jgi:hypothetical protein